jgi:hypothetical protein
MTATTASTVDHSADHLATAADLERVSAEVAATNPDLSAELAEEASSIRELVNESAEDPTEEPLLEELLVTCLGSARGPNKSSATPAAAISRNAAPPYARKWISSSPSP